MLGLPWGSPSSVKKSKKGGNQEISSTDIWTTSTNSFWWWGKATALPLASLLFCPWSTPYGLRWELRHRQTWEFHIYSYTLLYTLLAKIDQSSTFITVLKNSKCQCSAPFYHQLKTRVQSTWTSLQNHHPNMVEGFE